MNAKRLALTLVVVVSLVAMGSGAAATDGGTGANDCIPSESIDRPLGSDSEVGTECTGGGGCTLYCGP